MASEAVDIIMFNMSAYTDWQHGIANRNMYILHGLLRDERVRKIVAIDYLPFTFKRAVRQWFQNVLGGPTGQVLARGLSFKLIAPTNYEIGRVDSFAATGSPSAVQYKLFIYSTTGSWRRERDLYEGMQKEFRRLNLKNVVLWSYIPTFIGYFGKFGERLTVFDAVDNWQEHSSYSQIKDRLKVNYQFIRSKADLIFTTSEDLSKLFDRPAGCTFIPNGVDFEGINEAFKLTDRDIASLPRPIIGYIGTIQEDRVDVELIRYLAEQNPKKSIVLIGGVWPGLRQAVKERLRPLPNVHFLGRKSFRERPQYLREFDVGIIPHKVNEFNRHTNPMKLYEYLAAGKPVVTTPVPGLDKFKHLIYVASTAEAFNQAVIEALQESAATLREQRRSAVARESWAQRVNVMLELIFKQLK